MSPKCSAHDTFNAATSRHPKQCCRPCPPAEKSRGGGGGAKKPQTTHDKAEGADRPQLRGPQAAGASGFMLPTCHQMQVGHCGNSKFQMALFGWVGVFFPCLISKATRLTVIC